MESSSAHSTHIKLIQHFVGMGFPYKLVEKAIAEHGEDSAESDIFDALATYTALKDEQKCVDFAESASHHDENQLYLSDSDSWAEILDEDEEDSGSLLEKEKTLLTLENMGFSSEDAAEAVGKLGPETSMVELIDYISASQVASELSANLVARVKPKLNYSSREDRKMIKRKVGTELQKNNKRRGSLNCEGKICIPKPMIGFGVPSSGLQVTERTLPEEATGPPFFYYENIAQPSQGVWDKISEKLYGIHPEFVDSKYFCAAARKRGYIHNLPIKNRFELLPRPPLTIRDAFSSTKEWWPSWDRREHFNCLRARLPGARVHENICKALKEYAGEPPAQVQKMVLNDCKEWNLLWVGRNKVAPLEIEEFEELMGYSKNHTRGGGMSHSDRRQALGNSFQVNTVAYHLSVLKPLYPEGINVLSLFSGIGGAEVALHRLGIPLKNVVLVEKSGSFRDVVRSWWDETNQKGELIDHDDIQSLDTNRLERLIDMTGGFDLIIGGSPGNHLSGSNRTGRGLDDGDMSLFYEFDRVLKQVQFIMRQKQRQQHLGVN